MDNLYGKKVLASLNAIQFVKDGEAFGTKSEGADCFESLEDDDDFFKLNYDNTIRRSNAPFL